MEAIPVIIVAVVSGALWIFAMVQKHFAAPDPEGELEILRRRAAWLQERLDAARRENWEIDMVSPILDALTTTNYQLERVDVRTIRR